MKGFQDIINGYCGRITCGEKVAHIRVTRAVATGLLVAGLLVAECALPASAEIIKLKSGKTVDCTILFQNEEVVVVRDNVSGIRYQYPRSEVVETENENATDATEQNKKDKTHNNPTDSQTEQANHSGRARRKDRQAKESVDEQSLQRVETGRKVAMGVSLFGGGMAMPVQLTGEDNTPSMGGHAGADVMIGASNMFKRRIFLGGATGFHAYMQGGEVLSFIPIMLRAEVPLTLKRHAPMLGMGAGYGIGLQGTKGGLCADVEFGWRYSYTRKGAFFLGIFADFQGAQLTLTETVSGKEYTMEAYRNLCGFGAKMALYF